MITINLRDIKTKEDIEAVAENKVFIAHHARQDIPFLLNLIAEKDEEIERLQKIITSPTEAYMTSPIGDLTINSTGLRKAVDEIERLRDKHNQAAISWQQKNQECRKLQSEIERLREAQRWIPVEERLPDNEQDVFIWCDRCGGDRDVGWWSLKNKVWVVNGFTLCYNVTHWMPLPEPPKENKQ